MTPFLTVITPTYRRPAGLAACMESVRTQTLVAEIQQVVMVDHLGVGIDGMYTRVKDYAPIVQGQYVTFLCDDDRFASTTVVEELKELAYQHNQPPLFIVDTIKGVNRWPAVQEWPPLMGAIDLNCAVVRGDVWQRFARAYGNRYEGDFDHLAAMAEGGIEPVFTDLLLSHGAISRGIPEAA